MKTAIRLFLAALFIASAADAFAQPPNWMLDYQFMPHRGRIGVSVQPMTPELREFFKAPADRGVLASEVQPDRPAARAGLEVGDVIVSAGPVAIREPYDLVTSVARVPAGEKLLLEVVRGGDRKKLEIRPEGAAVRWADPEHWRDWVDRALHEGGDELRQRLQDLEKRLEDLERRWERKPGLFMNDPS